MKSVRDIPILENIPVLVRAALNVPIGKDGKVANPFRLKHAVPTINYLQERHARVILISHIDPPSGQKPQGTETLAPVHEAMKALIPGIQFCPVSVGPEARAAIRTLGPGQVLMLENLRRNAGEVANDIAFARQLAELADVFVEDSFDVCHREHASVVSVPKLLPAYAGLLVEAEVRELTKALTPAHPSLAIIGGAKFSTKEPVLTKLLESYDHVFVGGALANDFMKAGSHPVGASLVSGADESKIKTLLNNKKLLLPHDYIVAPQGGTRDAGRIAGLEEVKDDEAILDDGPKTIEALAPLVHNAKTILWNGPLGNYENGFTDSTESLVRAIADVSAYSVVGGGDTVAAIEKLNLHEKFSFISTGGGAMLEFISKGTLPGIAVLG